MNIEQATEEELHNMKKWLFQENLRLQQEKSKLEEERKAFEAKKQDYETEHEMIALKMKMFRKQLDKEKQMFELKWGMLEREVAKLAAERDEISRARAELDAYKQVGNYEVFFVGVNSEESLKKRYKDLLKIFHPDNFNGDTTTLQEINRQYDLIKESFGL